MTCDEFTAAIQTDPASKTRAERLAAYEHHRTCVPCRFLFEMMYERVKATGDRLTPAEETEAERLADDDFNSLKGPTDE